MISNIFKAAVIGVAWGASVSHAAVDAAKAKDLAMKNACLGCHAVNSRVVGPSYSEVAAKYKGMDAAKLAASIRAGSKGKWGAMEMPAQAHLAQDDLLLLADWVLAGAPDR